MIDDEGKSRGVLLLEEALALAQEKNLDLVEVNPASDPPVAKILEYGKFAYRQQKKERKTSHKSKELKRVKIGIRTSAHDLQTKAKQIEKFLKKGHRVRVEIFLRGREKTHRDLAKERLEIFMTNIKETYRVLEEIKKIPSGFTTIISQQ